MEKPFEHFKELFKIDQDINLPIQGGTGSSIDDPLVIKRSEIYNCVNVEYMLLDFFSETRGIEWKLLEQKLINYEEKRIDILKIETKQYTEQEIIIKIENYYFDITDCFEIYKQVAGPSSTDPPQSSTENFER